MGEIKGKVFIYKNCVEWETERKGNISSDNMPGFKVATPPEFKGHPGMWSPEDLFVASVNVCIMTTFLHYAERKKLEFISYKSEAEGFLEIIDNKFMFSEIIIRPLLTVKKDSDINDAKNILEISEKNCLISNSITSKVSVVPEINLVHK